MKDKSAAEYDGGRILCVKVSCVVLGGLGQSTGALGQSTGALALCVHWGGIKNGYVGRL